MGIIKVGGFIDVVTPGPEIFRHDERQYCQTKCETVLSDMTRDSIVRQNERLENVTAIARHIDRQPSQT